METPIVRHIPATGVAHSIRARAVSLIGPTTVASGVIFALVVARPLLSDLEAHDVAPR